MKEKENILETIHEILELTGNPYLVNIFNKYRKDEKRLNASLREYIRGIFYEIHENEENDNEKQSIVLKYIYINGIVIDSGNISRIELDFDYNPKKNKNNYFIRIVKKFPTPLEEEYIISFDSEESRDKGYEVLKGKLKLAKIYIA